MLDAKIPPRRPLKPARAVPIPVKKAGRVTGIAIATVGTGADIDDRRRKGKISIIN